ncbi:MAG TPA: hypothetical protein VK821_17030, partial [Dehalococcoidia bacterium]|nr:hypothetical protein [Dehalococcoidia bacterium]
QLDVSVDSLLSAVQAADQTLPCPQGPGGAAPGPSGGNAIFIGTGGSGAGGPGPIDTGLGQEVSAAFYRGSGAGGPGPIDTTAFFGAVAKSLGQGFTGQQVQSAFASAAPPLPDPSTLTTDLQNQLNSLATVLGVSADTLKSALKSLASSGGCLPPNTLGGFRLAKQIAGGGAPRPSGAGVGPIIIPFAGSTPPRLPGNPGDPLGLGLTPCGINLRAS